MRPNALTDREDVRVSVTCRSVRRVSQLKCEYPLQGIWCLHETASSIRLEAKRRITMSSSVQEEIAVMDDDRTGTSVATLKRAILQNLRYVVAKDTDFATDRDYFMAVAYTVRDRILARWLATRRTYLDHDVRIVSYLSAEFLLGPHLENNLLNLDIEGPLREATKEMGLDLDKIIGLESEPGLGNGGLGRLAACYLDSLATLGIPAIGYGIRYEFGMFHQEIRDGWQVELTDYWLRFGNPWEIRRSQISVEVYFGGHTEFWKDSHGNTRVRWIPASRVKGVAAFALHQIAPGETRVDVKVDYTIAGSGHEG